MDMTALSICWNMLEPTRQESQSVFGASSLFRTGSGRHPIKDFSHLFFKFHSSSNIFQHHSWDPMNMSPLGVCEGTKKRHGWRDPLLDHLDSKRWGATAVARSPTSSALSVPSQDSSGWQSENLTDLPNYSDLISSNLFIPFHIFIFAQLPMVNWQYTIWSFTREWLFRQRTLQKTQCTLYILKSSFCFFLFGTFMTLGWSTGMVVFGWSTVSYCHSNTLQLYAPICHSCGTCHWTSPMLCTVLLTHNHPYLMT